MEVGRLDVSKKIKAKEIDRYNDIIDITVDGRTIITDGTKLDTIEENAEVNNISDVDAANLTNGSQTTLHTHPGGGVGDMLKSVYDTDNDGMVDTSETLYDVGGNKTYGDISTEIDTDIAVHVALPDPHTQYQKESEKSVADGYASLDSESKIPEIEIPDVALTTIHKVNSQAEQLSLTVERGDVCIRTDQIKTYFALNSDNVDMSDWEEILAHSVQITYKIGEDLNAGDPVYIYNNVSGGTMKKVYSRLNDIGAGCNGTFMNVCTVDTDKIVVAYRCFDDFNYLNIRCGSVQVDRTVIWGAAVRVIAIEGLYIHVDKLSTDKFILTARGTSNYASAWVGNVSGTTIVMGLEHSVNGKEAIDITNCRVADNKFAVCYSESNKGICRIGSVVGTTITWGTVFTFAGSISYENWVCTIGTDNKIAIFYNKLVAGLSKGFVRGLEVTSNSITDDSAEIACTFTNSTHMVAENIATDRCALIFRDNDDGFKGKIIVIKFTGIIPVVNQLDMVTFDDKITYYPTITKLEDNIFIAAWCKYVSPYKGYLTKFTNTDTTLNKESNQIYNHSYTFYNTCCTLGTNRYYLSWWNAIGYYVVVEGDINNIDFTIGIMQENGLLDEYKKIDLLGGVTEQLSGMTPGLIQYIQDDLTISEVLSEYPIGIAITTTQMLIHKAPFGA